MRAGDLVVCVWTALLFGSSVVTTAAGAEPAAATPGRLAAPVKDGSFGILVGERPAVESHLDQAAIEAGRVSMLDVLRHGKLLFEARFNSLDGQGRPLSTGSGLPRGPNSPAFLRTSGPDANSCRSCHLQPVTGGAGDFSSNVFVMAQELDPVSESVNGDQSNERGSPSLMGIGLIELLAREMSGDLIRIRESARKSAQSTGAPVRMLLTSKNVSFGAITVLPDGRIDPSEIQGVDWDLVIRPFHQKGAVASIREFTNTALNHHHGIQTEERFGHDVDPDGDGKVNELTVGDVTALTLFQASLPPPGRVLPDQPERRTAANRGEALFAKVGCIQCHISSLPLDNSVFTDPGPFHTIGTLRLMDVPAPISIDLARQDAAATSSTQRSHVKVEAFSDLKRHDLNDTDYNHFANERVPQGTLAGYSRGSLYTHVPQPRPLGQFLTARLWGVGSTDPYGHRGDLTTLTEAIHFHGGEARPSRDAFFSLSLDDRNAITEFLKTLQILETGHEKLVSQD